MTEKTEAQAEAKPAKMVKVKLNPGVEHDHAGTLYKDQAEITMAEGHAKWLVEERKRASYA